MLDCNSDGFQCLLDCTAYWWRHRLLAGCNCKCGVPGMAGSVTEAQSHDECRSGRSVTGVYGSETGIQNKSVTGGMEKRAGTEV